MLGWGEGETAGRGGRCVGGWMGGATGGDPAPAPTTAGPRPRPLNVRQGRSSFTAAEAEAACARVRASELVRRVCERVATTPFRLPQLKAQVAHFFWWVVAWTVFWWDARRSSVRGPGSVGMDGLGWVEHFMGGALLLVGGLAERGWVGGQAAVRVRGPPAAAGGHDREPLAAPSLLPPAHHRSTYAPHHRGWGTRQGPRDPQPAALRTTCPPVHLSTRSTYAPR